MALVATPVVAQPPGGQQPGMLPLPPGYRPRTPPPAQPARPAPAATLPGSGASNGRVMYFHKPADALTATGAETDTGAVALAPAPDRAATPAVVPDVPLALLPPPASRYPAPPAAGVPGAAPVVDNVQPAGGQPILSPFVAQRKDVKIIPVDPKYVQLPPRENIFIVYNDLELEKAIMERVRQDVRDQWERQNPGKKYNTEEAERFLVFPALPVVSPPGVAYQPKTASYEPMKVVVEPGYVVHRRLHFEQKNEERAGWDLGPLSTVVTAAHFYRDVLFWPQSLASGCVTGFWNTSAGKCLPGTPSPYYLYPLGLTVTGTAAETLAVTTATFLFP